MQDKYKYGLALLALVVLFAIPFVLKPGAGFGGSDDAGSNMIQTMSPGYQPWFHSFWTPPPETESMLFALQASIGAIIIGYFIGYEKCRADAKKRKTAKID